MMKCTISTKVINEITDILARFVSKHSTLPILENIYIKGQEDTIIFRATDMEKFVELKLPISIEGEGALTINAKTFTDAIKAIDTMDVVLQIDPVKELITLKTSSDSFKLKGISASEYVAVPEVQAKNTISVNGEIISKGIEKTEFAVTEKNFSPVLTGVLMKIKQEGDAKKMIFVGTDSFRLAEYKLNYEGESQEASFLIPKTNINEIKKIVEFAISHGNNEITINLGDNLVSFGADLNGINVIATSLLIQGDFPDYDNESIMPTQYISQLSVKKDELDKAIKKISILTRDINNFISLQIADGAINITSGDTDRGDAQTSVLANISGEDVTLGVNGRYIQDFARITASNDININIASAEKPIVLRDPNDENYRYIIRPLMR